MKFPAALPSIKSLPRLWTFFLIVLPLLNLAIQSPGSGGQVIVQTEPATPPPTEIPTSTPTQEPYPPPTETTPPPANPAERPLVVLHSYSPSDPDVAPGKEFTIEISLINKGQRTAQNIVAIVSGGDFFPRQTGGVVAVGELVPGDKRKFSQPLTTAVNIWDKYVATLEITVNYTDTEGVAYSERLVLSFPIDWGNIISATRTPTPSPSPTPFTRPQLVITAYRTDVDQLRPGGQFTLQLNVQNLGQAPARNVTMILGGGGVSGEGPSETAQAPGGVSGGSGDLSNFAPIGSSNVQSLGDLLPGTALTASQQLIVNVSTNPGAYPLKVSFAYVDDSNRSFVDDQVITLLVYSPPLIEISFYRDPGMFFAGQPNLLPLQVVNIGKKSTILGNMTVTSQGADLSNNVILVGPLESGNYYTLDATVIPFAPGTLSLDVTVKYTDDFNQPQEIVQSLTVEVAEASVVEPEPGGSQGPGFPGEPGPFPPTQETLWQKILRFFRGLLGLDSGISEPQPGEMPPEGIPPEGIPPGSEGGPVIIP